MMMIGLGRVASKFFGPRALEIPWIDLGDPFWITLRDGSAIARKKKSKEQNLQWLAWFVPFSKLALLSL